MYEMKKEIRQPYLILICKSIDSNCRNELILVFTLDIKFTIQNLVSKIWLVGLILNEKSEILFRTNSYKSLIAKIMLALSAPSQQTSTVIIAYKKSKLSGVFFHRFNRVPYSHHWKEFTSGKSVH